MAESPLWDAFEKTQRSSSSSESPMWAEFDKTKPGVWSDIKNQLTTGFQGIALDTRELARRAFGDKFVGAVDTVDEWMHGKPSEELLKGNIEKAQQSLSPEMKSAMEKQWWDEENDTFGEAWKDPRAYIGNVVQSIPGTAITMFPALGIARGVYKAQIAAGVTEGVAAAKAATAAQIAGGLTEGLQQAGQTGRQVRDQILALDEGQLAGSEVMNSLMESGLSFADAKAKLAEDASAKAMTIAGVATGIFGGMGDRVLAQAFTKGLTGNLATRIAKGAAAEGILEEFPQSYLSKVGENIGMQEAQPEIQTTKGALGEGLGGLVAGGIMGGGMATVSKQAPELAEPLPQGLIGGTQATPTTAPEVATEAAGIPQEDNVNTIGSQGKAKVNTGIGVPEETTTPPTSPVIDYANTIPADSSAATAAEILKAPDIDTGLGIIRQRLGLDATPDVEAPITPAAEPLPQADPSVAPAPIGAPVGAELPQPEETRAAQVQSSDADSLLGGVGQGNAIQGNAEPVQVAGTQAPVEQPVQGPDRQVIQPQTILGKPVASWETAELESMRESKARPDATGPLSPNTLRAIDHELQARKAEEPESNPIAAELSQPAATETKQEYASTQTPLPRHVSVAVMQQARKLIAPEDIDPEHGLEDNPHITVKYGLHTADVAAVQNVASKYGPVQAKVTGIEIFSPEDKDYDVVVARVDSPGLHVLNKVIADAIPHTDTFPEYKPHITLGYVKKGTGKKYADAKPDIIGKTFTLDTIDVSDLNENATPVKLTGQPPAQPAPVQPETPVTPAAQAVQPEATQANVIKTAPGTYVVGMDGKEVARANLAQKADGSFDNYFTSIRVDPEVRRQGIATKIYDFVESDIGQKLRPSPQFQSPETKALWAKRAPEPIIEDSVIKIGGRDVRDIKPRDLRGFANSRNQKIATIAQAEIVRRNKVVQDNQLFREQKAEQKSSLFMAIKELGGLSPTLRLDLIGEKNLVGKAGLRADIFKKGAKDDLSIMARMLVDRGYIIDTSDVDGGAQQVRDMILEEMNKPGTHRSAFDEQSKFDRMANEREAAEKAEAEAIADALNKPSNWDTLTDGEKDAELDELFGPSPVAENQIRAAEGAPESEIAGAGEVGQAEPAPEVGTAAVKPEKNFREWQAEIKAENARKIASIGEVGDFAIVRNKSGNWQAILENASGEGGWRTQSFDENGFSGHSVYKTKEEAIRNAAQDGYYTRDDGALDRIQDTPAFRQGLAAADIIRRANGKEIDWETAHKQLDALGPLEQPKAEAIPAFALEAETPEQVVAREEAVKAAAEQKRREDAAAVAKEKRAANKAEQDRRAAEVLAEREAAKKAEIDALARQPLVLGQEAPAPIVKKVTTEEAAGQGDLLAANMTPAQHLRAAADKMDQAAKPVEKAAPESEPVEQAAPEAAQQENGPNTEDAGVELTYNRRNRIRTGIKWEAIADKNEALRVSETTKQNIYPRPDYEELVASGMNPLVAHIVKQVYDSIAAKPAFGARQMPTDADLQSYIAGVNRVMTGTLAWANDKEAVGRWAQSQAKYAGAMLGKPTSLMDLANQSKTLIDTVYQDGWKAHRGEIHLVGGNKMLGALQPGYREGNRAVKAIKEGWPAHQEAWQRSFVIEEKDGRFFIMQKANKWRTAKGQQEGGYDSHDSAVEGAISLTKRENKQQVSDKGISVESAERVGEARRMEGEDISSDKLKETFGFKGVNFGTWMKGDTNQSERQLHLNHAYDAFMDLADILGVPHKAMSLNGMLGLAIGAQGSGHYAAHFVPGVNEINLTRTSGAGSLAHEFGHGLDHYFATLAGIQRSREPFLTEHVGMVDSEGYTKRDGKKVKAFDDVLRPEVAGTFKSIVDAMNTKLYTETKEQVELQLIASKVKSQKSINNWLAAIKRDFMANQVDEKKFDALAERIRTLDLGDGSVVAGSANLSPAVDDLRGLFKEKTGRAYSLDQIKGLQANVNYAVFLNSDRAAERNHVPQQVATDYAKAATALDKGKQKAYWSTNLEKFARAFDAFVSDKLASIAAKNTYLSHADRAGETVPAGDERTAINKALQILVDTVETRETDKGVALFSQSNDPEIFNDPSAEESKTVQDAIEGKSVIDTAKFIAENAPSEDYRLIGKRVMTQLQALRLAGMKFSFNVSHIGDQVPAPLIGTRGMVFRPDGSTETQIWIQGSDVAGYVGTSYETVLHELVHAATQTALYVANRRVANGAKLQENFLDLHAVSNAIVEHYNQRVLDSRSGKIELTPFEKAMYGRRTNATRDEGEVLAWALTNREFQRYLETIPYKAKNLWTAFVSAVRKFLGLDPKAETALSEILRISDALLNEPVLPMLKMAEGIGMPTQINRAGGLLNNSSQSGNVGGAVSQVERNAPEWVKAMPADMQESLRKAGAWREKQTLQDRIAGWTENWQGKLKQKVFDQFDPIKSLDYHAYMLARMSKSAAGALETSLFNGTVFMDNDGALDVNYEKGGFVVRMQELKGEHDRVFSWVIGNRAERLLGEGRERNLTPDDINRLKTLNQGNMADGNPRAPLYLKALSDMTRYNKSVLDVAERAGLIDGASRSDWEKDFYIPFYRLMEEEEGKPKGPIPTKGLVNQYAMKTLKGGPQAIGDPMENIIQNWAHLLDASLKNNAALASLNEMQKIGGAIEGTESVARDMAKAAGLKNAVVSVMDQGSQRWFMVEDPLLLDAVTALNFTGFSGPAMKVMSTFKRWLTYGVTISPSFRIRNVMRDSISMIGTNPASYNVLDNVLTGWGKTKEGSPEYASMIAGGGVIRFGTMETDNAANVKRLIDEGVDRSTILDNPAKIKGMLKDAYDWWMRVGDRSENMNRAALYKKLRDEGKTHLEASYAARDTMDFSMGGTSSAIRFLAQTVPFFNARLQGMYKLGRGAAEDPLRFAYVVGGAALASIALMLAYQDDDDWKQREDFDRETFWWFKIGDKAFRIPKPFEIGAIGTIAERGLEAMITNDLTGKQFASRVGSIVMQQLSMNPVPQLAMPLIETWANRSAFTGRPIESMGMDRLSKAERIAPHTSAFAQLAGKNGLVSPVQIDHLVNGYFGWLGMHAVATADLALRPVMGLPSKPAMRIDEVFVLGDFVRDMPAYQSKYVTHLYEHGKEVQEAMADLRNAQKIGATEKAAEILQDKGDKLRLYRLYTHAESQMTKINQQIKLTQRRSGDEDSKREKLDRLYAARNRIAKITEQTAQRIQ